MLEESQSLYASRQYLIAYGLEQIALHRMVAFKYEQVDAWRSEICLGLAGGSKRNIRKELLLNLSE